MSKRTEIATQAITEEVDTSSNPRSKGAKWFSILVDEVTDCAVTEHLLIYIGYVDKTGEPQNGVGARLKAVCPLLVRTHCINHRLTLACGDANDQVRFITTVETTLKQLWRWHEYPKRCSAYIKVCQSLRQIQVPDPTQKKSLAVKVQKACRTRWLSTGQSVSSVCKNLVALMQTLRKFKGMMLQLMVC